MANREVKIFTVARNWTNRRYGMDEAPVKPREVILFDEKAMAENWTYKRFGVDERELKD